MRCRAFQLSLLHRHLLETADTVTHYICGNRETESLCGEPLWRKRHLCRGNTDKAAREIDHRATAIAGINCRVGLDQVLVVGLLDGDVPFVCAQHASADRTAVAHRVADYNYCLTEQVRRNIVEIDEGKIG